jgi:putative heme-binding domain-containing protein
MPLPCPGAWLLLGVLHSSSRPVDEPLVALRAGDTVCLLGSALAERMQHDGWLEARLQARRPELGLHVRNLGFSGDEVTVHQRTLNFGKFSADGMEGDLPEERYLVWDRYLEHCGADVVLACLGFNESFAGPEGLAAFRVELADFVAHVRGHNYGGDEPPRLVLVGPQPVEDLRRTELNAATHNARIAGYDAAMAAVAKELGVPYVSLIAPLKAAYARASEPLTINGVHLNTRGNEVLARVLEQALLGTSDDPEIAPGLRERIQAKNEAWFQRYRATDGYNVYGGRSRLVYPGATSKTVYANFDVLQRELDYLDAVCLREDAVIHALARTGQPPVQPPTSPELPALIDVESNRKGDLADGHFSILDGKEAIDRMKTAPGMRVTLFADEKRFPELVNPVQMAFDMRGRLWVAAWPTYPHWRPDQPMDDKLLILEDTDGDGEADQCKTFAGDLHNPTGFEFWNGGVLVAQVPDLVFLRDTDGDDHYDTKERLLHGLSSADTHHSANSFVIGPDGALYFQEGTFHRSQVESPFGPVRARNACAWRFEPRSGRVERYIPYNFANPHGHVFDRWGQDFFTDGTGNQNYYVLPFSGAMPAGMRHPGYGTFFPQRSRPVGGSEILSSRAFPAENQGSYLLANVIGFQGVFQYRIDEAGAGFGATELDPIVESTDPNFRPVDLEVGPDGALYLLDWQNPLIGHMQHHLRDPNRDVTHGRVYRVTHEGRATLEPDAIDGQPIESLLERLRSPEDRVRYRARIELSSRDDDAVARAVKKWIPALPANDPELEHHLLEGLWVLLQHDRLDLALLDRVLDSNEPRARAAAVRVLRYGRHAVPDALQRLEKAVEDPHPRVRLEAVIAASYLDSAPAAAIALRALHHETDRFLDYGLAETMRALEVHWKAALRDGSLALDDDPTAVAYLLDRVGGEELMALPHTTDVLTAATLRHDVSREDRREALRELSARRDTSVAEEVLGALQAVDARADGHAAHVIDALGELLVAELENVPLEWLVDLTGAEHLPPTRALGYGAWIARERRSDPAWEVARTSVDGLSAFLDGLRWVADPGLQASLFARVRPLAFTPPAELLGDPSRPPMMASFFEPAPRDARRETFDALAPKATFPVEGFTLELDEIGSSDSFGLAFRGQLSVPESGEYRFFVTSDDGSRLYVDGTPVVENDGPHPMQERNGATKLAAGPHEIFLGFFESGGAEGLAVEWQGPSFARQPIPAAALGSSPVGELREAALRALAAMPGHADEKLADAARLAAEPFLLSATVDLLRSVEQPSVDGLRPVLETLEATIGSLDAVARTDAGTTAALGWAREASAQLPAEEGQRLRAAFDGLGGAIVLVRTVPHQMLYDLPEFWVEAGKPVAIVFQNNDLMPHNMVIAIPGALASVGEAAERMVGGEARGHIPETDEILWHTGLLKPGESERLTFVAPDDPGDRPYLCTYPGHWRVMNGVMHVTEVGAEKRELVRRASAEGSAAPRTFVQDWTLADLAPGLTGNWRASRSVERGRELFGTLACARCHKLGDLGTTVGPDLAEVGTKYDDLALLRQILEPSESVLEGWSFEGFDLEDESRVVGRVLYEDEHELHVAQSLLAPDDLTVVDKHAIADRWDTKLSPMPSGLLVTLTVEEILDLLAFLKEKR